VFRQTGGGNSAAGSSCGRKARWAVAAAAALVPLLLLMPLDYSSFAVEDDTESYVRPGATFWRTGSYSSEQSPYPGPEMGRTPVYPLFVGLFAADGTLDVLPVLLAQVLLRVLLVTLILTLPVRGRIGRLDWRLVAAALTAADLPSALAALQVLTETFSSFLLVLAFWLYLRWRRGQRLPWLLGAGIIAGAATLTRPLNLFFPPLLLLLAAWDVRRLPRFPKGVALAALFAAATLLPFAWVLRNYACSGKMIFSLTSSKTLLFYRAAGIVAEQEGRSLSEVQERFREREAALAQAGRLTAWETAERRETEAWQIIRGAPGIHLRLAAEGFVRALAGPGVKLWDDWGAALRGGGGKGWPAKLLTAASLLQLAGLYLFAATGLVRAERRGFPCLGVWCLSVFLLLILVAAGPEAYSRFRVPVMPFLAVGAALLWVSPRGRAAPSA
jgi:hypothetical protein